MSFFDPVGLGELRQITETSLPHRAALKGLVEETRPGGVVAHALATLRSDVPCRLSPVNLPTGSAEAAGQNVPAGATWRVVFRAQENLTDVRTLTVTGPDDNGLPFSLTLSLVRPDTPVTDGMWRVVYGNDVKRPSTAGAS